MTEFHPVVVEIKEILPHDNADALELTLVAGEYPVVIRKGEYKVGDLAAYLPVDTVVSDNPIFAFLDKKRLKAKRLRGVFSMGLLVKAPEGLKVGDSVIEAYGLKKYVYEEEKPDVLSSSSRLFDSPPKTWAPQYYDLEGLRAYPNVFEEGEEVVLVEKVDGSNIFVRYCEDKLWVKSRNYFKKQSDGDMYWDVAVRYDLESKLKNFQEYGIYGEVYGFVSGGFIYDCEVVDNKIQNKLRIFDIFDFENNKFLDYDDFVSVANQMGLDMAPELYRGPWNKELKSIAEQDSVLVSTHPKANNISEGFVIRPVKESFHHKLGRKILKHKGERYWLKK